MGPVVQVEARLSGRNVVSQVFNGGQVGFFSQHDLLIGSINRQLNIVDRATLHLAESIDNSLINRECYTVDISTTTNVDSAVSLFANYQLTFIKDFLQ